jgi:pimeloyl-ACP methyl ester carboxylesterase
VASIVVTSGGNAVRQAIVDDLTIEYVERGDGEPIVFIHAGLCGDWFLPLLDEPALAGHRLIAYHRVGYGGSSRRWGQVSIADHARHCRVLMRHLAVDRAHLVGHSSSGNIVLQVALDAPDAVRSLVLMEPALMPVPSRDAWARAVAQQALEQYRAGDRAGAIDTWMRGVAGEDYRAALDAALPGAFARMVADAPTFFEQELPAVHAWAFGRDEAARVTQPALAVLGGRSHEVSAVWSERQALLEAWLPDVEPFVLPGATHMLHLHNPRGLADALARFVASHPLESARAE